jgi:type IV secretion system protein VirB3
VAEVGSNLIRPRGHRALSRLNLLMGADHEPARTRAVNLIFVFLTPCAALFCAVIWVVAIAALRTMANADPLMRRVYVRHISCKPYYRSTAAPWRRY